MTTPDELEKIKIKVLSNFGYDYVDTTESMKAKHAEELHKKMHCVYKFLEMCWDFSDCLCDCAANAGCHSEECRTMLFRADVNQLEEELKRVKP